MTPPPPAEQQKKIDDLRKDVDDLKKAAADKKPDSDEKLADAFKEGKLIRYGITAGAAVAVMTPLFSGERQKQAGVSGMPYIAILPGWWTRMGKITRAYCTASWLTGWGDGSAQKSANKAAEDWAVETVQDLNTLNARYAAAMLEDKIKTQYKSAENLKIKRKQSEKTKYGKPLRRVEDDYPSASDGDKIAAFIAHPALYPGTVYDTIGWDEKLAGSCSMLWLGGYVGIPGKFTVNGRALDADPEKARDFNPVVSTGIVIAPLSALAVLLGVTVSNVVSDVPTETSTFTPEQDPGRNHRVVSATVAIGGNLDLVGALLGGGGK
ncbi:MAG: hypothetical protein WDO74_17885 [Pseudomonadota bacterium]